MTIFRNLIHKPNITKYKIQEDNHKSHEPFKGISSPPATSDMNGLMDMTKDWQIGQNAASRKRASGIALKNDAWNDTRGGTRGGNTTPTPLRRRTGGNSQVTTSNNSSLSMVAKPIRRLSLPPRTDSLSLGR